MVVRSSIEWLCMEDCHSVKLSRLIVGFDCAGIERLSVPQPNSCLLPSYWPSPDLHCFSSALSQARRGPTHPVTVMFYTPRGRAAIRNPWP